MRQTGFRCVFEALVGGEMSGDAVRFAREAVGVDGRPGLERAVERLRGRKLVLVGHNLFTDIVYLYRTFIGPLPDTLDEFSAMLHELFPKIVDTKFLATHAGGDLNVSPTLEEIARGLEEREWPKIRTHADHGKYEGLEAFHEAGFDSLLTATIMLRLAGKLGVERSERSEGSERDESNGQSKKAPESSEGGIQLPPQTPTATSSHPLSNNQEKPHHPPVPSPPSSRKKTHKAPQTRNKPPPTNPTRFQTKNMFDLLGAGSLEDAATSPSSSSASDADEDTSTPKAQSTWATQPQAHWSSAPYTPNTTDWVPIRKNRKGADGYDT